MEENETAAEVARLLKRRLTRVEAGVFGTYDDELLFAREDVLATIVEAQEANRGRIEVFYDLVLIVFRHARAICVHAYSEDPPTPRTFVHEVLHLDGFLRAADARTGFLFLGVPPSSDLAGIQDPISCEPFPTLASDVESLLSSIGGEPANFLDVTGPSHAFVALHFGSEVRSSIVQSMPSKRPASRLESLDVSQDPFFAAWRDHALLRLRTKDHDFARCLPGSGLEGETLPLWRLPSEAEFRKASRLFSIALENETRRAVEASRSAGSEFADLAERNARDREVRGLEERKRTELAEKMRRTHDAVELAYRGTEERPTRNTFDENPREVLLTSAEWAPLIIAAADAWESWPGGQVLVDDPIRTEGTGVEAAERIWRRAISGASEQDVARLLEDARRSLGPWDGKGNPCDSELGLLTFFRQLYKHLNGSWNPPFDKRNPTPSPKRGSDGIHTDASLLQSAETCGEGLMVLPPNQFTKKELKLANVVPLLFDKKGRAWTVDSKGAWHPHRLPKPRQPGGSLASSLRYLQTTFAENRGARLLNRKIAERAGYGSEIAASRALHNLMKRKTTGRLWKAILDPPPTTSPRDTGWRLTEPRLNT